MAFRVTISDVEKARLRDWREKATALGISKPFDRALRRLTEQLENDPVGTSAPAIRYLHGLGLPLFHLVYLMLYMQFVVDEAKQIVFIKRFYIVPGHPLGGSSDHFGS
ncbi:MAG TPA: hypothetical protein VKS79_11105 [Gemmataceae bacterium]|nr:hypothetical protein [Gemmataceae bacterium]